MELTTSMETADRELLPEQAAAAYEIRKHVSVTAGPGSGKTMVLVERYLHILRERNLSIDQIVAITFTNRAANEMRERVRARMNRIVHTATGDERKRWLNYKRTLDGAIITTIHGFCARLLREFPVEARIDPQFLLLDEHRAAMLLESVTEEVLSEFISSGHVEISRLTLGVGRSKLAAALVQLYRDVRGQGLSLRDLALLTANSHATEDDHAQALAEVSSEMNNFLAVRRTTPAAKAKQSEASSEWAALRPLIQTIPDADALADYCRKVEAFRQYRPAARGDLASHIKTLDELLWRTDLLGRVPQICFDIFAQRYALEMVLMLMRIDERLTQEKQKVSALDFDDLELRALDLLSRPEVMTRATERYKFFLVDEFQDTNDLQRKLLERLALQGSRRESANLFIVGDRKQSIYGFRGADVDVFREMTTTLLTAGGENMPLLLNFRSQPQLISFFNRLFSRLFVPSEEIDKQELMELGYVAHEPGEAKREVSEREPLIEVMITTEAADENDIKAQQTSRERDAEQLSTRIRTIVDAGRFNYSDIALLFRAMTHVQTYESAFRRANIPYQTVLGRGFYQREEITDLIQLLRFLDNKTDELALAAVLRSPLCGISDNGLLALRCAPWLDEVNAEDRAAHFTKTRALYMALLRHRDIAFISDEEHELLERAAILIKGLIARRHHYSIGALLRYAVEQTEYSTVIAATFDGAQRLANVQRLFTLAERFERSGDYLIRDFVRYVEEFEAIGSRESEGQIDEATNAVRLMTIHQAKGLEFPVVIIPDLQRLSRMQDNWVILDRHRGLTLKVPDGRGKLVAGCTFNKLEQRHEWREQFESMRLLYVAATRARERLILSGTTKDLNNLGLKNDTWLNWIWQALEWPVPSGNNVVELQDNTQVQITLNLAAQTEAGENLTQLDETVPAIGENAASLYEAFPLLRTIQSESGGAVHRFSVTQLLNYQRCPRQYYFDRVLHAPADDALAVWNNAEAPEPPANLTATLKGAVIHRFCETYSTGDPLEDRLSRSFDDVLRSRQAELADRLNEINREQAIAELLPLARNYLSSAVFARVERAQRFAGAAGGISDLKVISPFAALHSGPGLWSELGFRLRRPLGIITGAIDKLLVTPTNDGLQIEIIDFKTNRLREKSLPEAPLPEIQNSSMGSRSDLAGKRRRSAKPPLEQIAFDFNALSGSTKHVKHLISDLPSEDRVRALATDYELQMQAYALAVNELITPASKAPVFVTSTLHFLDPNVEFHLPENLMTADACIAALDDAMMQIASSLKPGDFPVRPAVHCRMCNFHSICAAGREWLRASRTAASTERAGEYRVAEAGR